MRLYLSFVVLLKITLITAADAEIRFSPRQAEIIPIVGSFYIDKALHKEFWDEFPAEFTSDPAKVAEFEAEMPKFLFAMNEYNMSLWEAAELSLRTSEPTRTERLRTAEESIVRLEPGDLTGQTNALLKAAAEGSAYSFQHGPEAISYEYLSEMILRSEASFERSQLLYKHEYSPALKLRNLKEINSRIVSSLPFDHGTMYTETDSGDPVRIDRYALGGLKKFIQIDGLKNPHDDAGVLKLFYMALKSIYDAKTTEFTFPNRTKFKELDSVEFEHKTLIDSTKINFSTRIIYRPSDEYFIIVQSGSEDNIDVAQARHDFESSLELGQ
jgi:hypothetical protein